MPGEGALRLTAFFGILGVMALWEHFAPRRALTQSKSTRWKGNLGIVALNILMLRVLLPVTGAGIAAIVETRQWGVLNQCGLAPWQALLLSLVALDLVIYFQHVMFHRIPLLWRVHRMHHVDLDFDVTTGNRFHPLEILLSMLIKYAAITAIGVRPAGVLVFEIILNGTAMFNHSNVRIAVHADRFLRWIVVTPDMHRVHHSVETDESNSNFGFNLPWWDRLFGTYHAQPRNGHKAMTIGLRSFRDPRICLPLLSMLKIPFRKAGGKE